MPTGYKLVLLFTILLPKLIINFGLTILSLRFIGTAGSYNNIVLNCLAVSFVTEIDDMAFAVMVNQQSSDYLNAFPTINIRENTSIWLILIEILNAA